MTEPMHVVPVELAARSYEVVIGSRAVELLNGRLVLLVPGRRAFVVADAGLPRDLVDRALGALATAGFAVSHEFLQPTEEAKSLATVGALLERVAEARLDRGDVVIGLGGGIVGDVAGFVAATYRRGVAIVQAPTTLLAMVDASVGGKTGVNLRTGDRLLKNMVGAFHQPRIVVADTDALSSLPPRDLRCGVAECLKHGMIAETALGADAAGAFDEIAAASARLAAGDLTDAPALIDRNVRVKAAVVASDELELGAGRVDRAILNLGHTFAHVLEGIAELSPDGDPASAPLRHGEAVALGLIAAGAMGRAMGKVSGDQLQRVIGAVAAAGLPTGVAGLPRAGDLVERMGDDKKVAGGVLRVVVPVGLGRTEVVAGPPESAVAEGWRAIGAA